MNDTMIFLEGTIATCNRNHADNKHPLPMAIEGMRENSNAYRLRDFCILGCGHFDTHWVFLSDNPNLLKGAAQPPKGGEMTLDLAKAKTQILAAAAQASEDIPDWGCPPYQVILHRLDDNGDVKDIPVTSKEYLTFGAVVEEHRQSQAMRLLGGIYYWRTVIDATGETMTLGEPLMEKEVA